MARVRLPGVLTTGLAQGIPLAQQGILEVLKMRSREEEAAADRALRERSLQMQEQEFGQRQQARSNIGTNLGLLSQALEGTPAKELVYGELPPTAEESAGGIAPPIVQPGQPAVPPMSAAGILSDPRTARAYQDLTIAGMGDPLSAIKSFHALKEDQRKATESAVGRKEVEEGMRDFAEALKPGAPPGASLQATLKIAEGQRKQGKPVDPVGIVNAFKDEREGEAWKKTLAGIDHEVFSRVMNKTASPGEVVGLFEQFLGSDSKTARTFAAQVFQENIKSLAVQDPKMAAAITDYVRGVALLPEGKKTEEARANIFMGVIAKYAGDQMTVQKLWASVPPDLKAYFAESESLRQERVARGEELKARGKYYEQGGTRGGAQDRTERDVKARLDQLDREEKTVLGGLSNLPGDLRDQMLSPEQRDRLERIEQERADLKSRSKLTTKPKPSAGEGAPPSADDVQSAANEISQKLFRKDAKDVTADQRRRVLDEVNRRFKLR